MQGTNIHMRTDPYITEMNNQSGYDFSTWMVVQGKDV